ncbi:MAG TPA: SDR family NAD(P)-dependent oxidoreductase, partial [Solirubrobacteraceae bacterium]
MQIAGSTVLLTGATGGIGQAIGRSMHERGGKLILTGRRVDVLEPLAKELDARVLAVDLAEVAEVDRLVREAGEVDILVANAALPASGTLDSFSLQEIDRALDVNLRAPIVLAHALAPAMVARGNGHLL